uniref:Si:ch211-166e11.5 n=1 Tax=Nothobranchius furzeri TaxID=105023 RepID=A0A1A8UN91_NOTFU
MANQRLNKLTNFLTEHFTALALEVFGEVQSIVESYDEENKRLRSMLRTVIGPEIKLHMIDAGPYVKATTSTSEQPEEPKSSFEFQLSQPGEKSPKEEPFEFEIKWNVEQQHQPGELHTSNVASVVKEDPEQKEEKMDMMHANPVDIHVESCPDNSATSSADEGENEEHSSLSDEASTSSLIIRSTNGASNSKVKNQQNPTTTIWNQLRRAAQPKYRKPKPVIQKTLLQMPRMIIDKSLILSKDEQMSFLSRLHESYKDFPEDQKPMIAQMNLTADIEMVQCAFGEVPKGSPLSYQFPVPSAKDFIVHDDAPPQPDLPLFSRILEQASDIPTLSAQEQHNLNNMYVSWEQAHNLERSTRGRKQSAKELEKMRLIGRFKEISQLKPGRSNADKLVFKIRHGKPRTFKILSGQGGPEELKLEATREYCRNLCVNLYPCGLVIPPHAPWMGAFPDGVVYDPKEKNVFGLLHTIHVEGNSYTECSFLAFWECGIQLKQSYWHYWHIQGELMVTGMMWCDLLVHSTSDMLVQRIYRDETPIKCLKKKLEEFFYYYYLPQLNDEK